MTSGGEPTAKRCPRIRCWDSLRTVVDEVGDEVQNSTSTDTSVQLVNLAGTINVQHSSLIRVEMGKWEFLLHIGGQIFKNSV